jgi:hypothetical protein
MMTYMELAEFTDDLPTQVQLLKKEIEKNKIDASNSRSEILNKSLKIKVDKYEREIFLLTRTYKKPWLEERTKLTNQINYYKRKFWHLEDILVGKHIKMDERREDVLRRLHVETRSWREFDEDSNNHQI